MNAHKAQTGSWKRNILIVLLVIGGIWGGLKWAEKQFARFEYKFVSECDGYEFHGYRAFSPLRIFPFEEQPIFVRLVEKKTGRVIGETGVYWMLTAPDVFCPNTENPKQIRIYLGKGASDEHLETFEVNP